MSSIWLYDCIMVSRTAVRWQHNKETECQRVISNNTDEFESINTLLDIYSQMLVWQLRKVLMIWLHV